MSENNHVFLGGDTIDGSDIENTSLGQKSKTEEKTVVDIKSSKGVKNLRPPWKKGESGNPGGRPKKAQSITAQLEAEAQRKVSVNIGGVKYVGRNMEILAKRMFERGIRKVEPRMCSEIIDRVDGRAVSALELVGRNGEPIKIVVSYDGNERA